MNELNVNNDNNIEIANDPGKKKLEHLGHLVERMALNSKTTDFYCYQDIHDYLSTNPLSGRNISLLNSSIATAERIVENPKLEKFFRNLNQALSGNNRSLFVPAESTIGNKNKATREALIKELGQILPKEGKALTEREKELQALVTKAIQTTYAPGAKEKIRGATSNFFRTLSNNKTN